jgi:hypothetical protein
MAGAELARRISRTHPELRALADDIESDRKELLDVMGKAAMWRALQFVGRNDTATVTDDISVTAGATPGTTRIAYHAHLEFSGTGEARSAGGEAGTGGTRHRDRAQPDPRARRRTVKEEENRRSAWIPRGDRGP